MKREFLEGLGLEKEAIDKIMTENGIDIEKQKQEALNAQTELKDTQDQLTSANSTIDELKKSTTDNEALQNQIKEYETTINDLKTTSDITKKEFMLKDQLKEIGVKDADYLIYKHGGVDKFSFDPNGKLIGLEETIMPYKESIPHLFNTGKVKTNYEPVGGDTPPGFADPDHPTYEELAEQLNKKEI